MRNFSSKVVLVCGILVSCISVGMCENGYSINFDEASVACLLDNKNACNTLIRNATFAKVNECLYYTPKEPQVINHISSEGLKQALAFGNKSCYLIAQIYQIAGYDHEAKPYYEKLCKANDVFSCGMLASMYIEGEGTRQNYFKAVELYQKACNMKIANNADNKEARKFQGMSCDILGQCYEKGKVCYENGKGQGAKQNLSIAKQYYGKACDLGNQQGCDNYKMLNQKGY